MTDRVFTDQALLDILTALHELASSARDILTLGAFVLIVWVVYKCLRGQP